MPSSYYDERRSDDRRSDDYRNDRDDRRGDRDRKKHSRRQSPAYEEEEIIEARRRPRGSRDDPHDDRSDRRSGNDDRGGGQLVRRARDDDSDFDEEIPRGYIPDGRRRSGRDDRDPPRRAKSARDSRRGGGRYDDYDSYDDDPPRRRRDDRRHRRDYSSDESVSPPRERRKSLGEQALAALGLGGAAGALAANGRSKSHGRERDRSRGGRRGRYDSSDDSRSRSRGGRKKDKATQQEKIQQAVKAAVIAGATEAFRQRKQPGDWTGEKGKRVLTAAVGAGGIDGLIDRDPGKSSTRHTIEAVIGGLAGNRLLNGSREEGAERSRSRSRSRGRDGENGGGSGGLGGLAAGGLAAAAAKAFADRTGKSKDRGRDRGYSDSDSEDSRDARLNRRSKSVSDYARQGMAALGIGGDKAKRDDNRTRDAPRGGYDDYSPPRPRGDEDEGGNGIVDHPAQHSLSRSDSSSGDSVSSSEEERERKSLGRKQLLTAGLASVATIHAAHQVYQSYEGRKKRHEELAAGEITPKEARKKKNRARLQDAASVGIAAIGIKGAYSEWKEMKEQREEAREFDKKREERHERRLLHHKHDQDGTTYSPGYGSEQGFSYPNSSQDQYHAAASAPDLAPGYYPEPPGAQAGGYYDDPGHPGGPTVPHYSDGNPFHVGGVPPPPMGPDPQRF